MPNRNPSYQLPRLRSAPKWSVGPRLYQLDTEPQVVGGPGEPPPGFVTPKTSATEWPVYWGLAVITGLPEKNRVRNGPFYGGIPMWQYQKNAPEGTFQSASIDFVVWQTPQNRGQPIAIRVQTEFFHLFTNNDTQAYDEMQRVRVEGAFQVVDLYDFMYMQDKTGQAVIKLLKQAMGLIEPVNPLIAGTARRVR